MQDSIGTTDRPIQNNLLGLNKSIEELGEAMDTEIDRKTHQISDRLSDAYYRASSAFDAYLDFRQTRGRMFGGPLPKERWISRAASYPDSHIMHFSILAGLVLFEGLANAYFFSKGSDLGLLGGWIQAITVAFTNVIASFFLIGFLGVRLLQNPDRPFSFAAAVIGVPVAVCFVVFLNFSAAHYRDLLELNAATLAMGDFSEPSGEILAPVTRALTFTPFETLEALLLFILGVTFAAIAAFKGTTFDDRLIGYGAMQRRAITSSAHLAGVLKQLPHHHREDADIDDETATLSAQTRRRAFALKREIDDFFAADSSSAIKRYRRMRDMDDGLAEHDTTSREKPPFPGA